MDWVRGETIGYGSFATVSLASAVDNSSNLPPLMAAKSCSNECADILINEKRILDQIGYCPQIIQCFGDELTIENRGEKFYNLLLEYASRGSLADLVKKSRNGLPESDIKSYTSSILKGLCFIHSKGFAHCDIKLQNILVCDNGVAKIADFGLATKFDGGKKTVTCRGTPLYMSPESVNENLHEASGDIWGLGCAIFEMATGKTVWANEKGWNFGSLMMKIGAGDDLPGIPADLSEEGKDFVLKCFVKDHGKRWTAEMLLNHPFVRQIKSNVGLNEEELSPRSPFSFPSLKTAPDCEIWASSDSTIDSAMDRIGWLVRDEPNWSFYGNWITVR